MNKEKKVAILEDVAQYATDDDVRYMVSRAVVVLKGQSNQSAAKVKREAGHLAMKYSLMNDLQKSNHFILKTAQEALKENGDPFREALYVWGFEEGNGILQKYLTKYEINN